MEAVILKSGIAVQKSKLSSVVLDIYGFLSSFKDSEQKDVLFLNVSDFLKESSDKARSGYYYLKEYTLYMNNPSTYTIEKLIKDHTYKKFINAEVDDSIKLEIISFESYDKFYEYKEYNFIHLEKTRNYLLEVNSQTLNPAYIGIGVLKTKVVSNIAKAFVTQQMLLFETIPIDQQNKYFENVVKCALRINMINKTIFPILLSTLPNNNGTSGDAFLLIETLKNSLNSQWQTSPVISITSTNFLQDISDYYTSLTNFYLNCFSNQNFLKQSDAIVRLPYFVTILDIDLLSTVSTIYKLKFLKLFVNGFNDKNFKLDSSQLSKAIVKISDSFKENQTSEIDDFLDGLLNSKNSIEVNETLMVNVSPIFFGYEGEPHKRTKITLFELVYRKLKANFFKELWQHSPLYYKVNSALNLDAKTSPLSAFITKVYTLWTHSKYNPNRNNVYNPNCIGYGTENANTKTFIYTHKPASTFEFTSDANGGGKIIPKLIDRNKAPLIINLETYFINSLGYLRDTIVTDFIDFDRVLICTNDFRNANIIGIPNPWANIELRNTSAYFAYGYYNIYQPVQAITNKTDFWNQFRTTIHSWSDGSETINQTYLPAFLFHYMQEKEDTEFIYGLLWTVIQAAYKAIPEAFVFKKIVETSLNGIYEVLNILETAIPEDTYDIINDYANQCSLESGNHEFCKAINELSTWINNYRVSNNEIVPNQVQNAASNILLLVEESGWPSDFDEEDGPARELIITLAGEGDNCSDIKNRVEKKIKEAGDQYSINADNENTPLFSDADYEEVCNYVANLDLSDDFTFNSKNDIHIAFIFNAHRKEKQANVSTVKERIDYWINLKKSISLGGRNKIPYIFGNNITEAQSNYTNFTQKIKELFGHYDFLGYQDKRIGGSALYKNPPGDIDMNLFINHKEINNLLNEYSKTWKLLSKTFKKEKEIEKALKYSGRVWQIYKEKQLIMGYLIIKYDPQFRTYFIMNEDRYNLHYTSPLINYSETKAGFDITIKDNSIDMNGTPPYIILNL